MKGIKYLLFFCLGFQAMAFAHKSGRLLNIKSDEVIQTYCIDRPSSKTCAQIVFIKIDPQGGVEFLNKELIIGLGDSTAVFQERRYYFATLKDQAFQRFSPIPFPVYMINTNRARKVYDRFFRAIETGDENPVRAKNLDFKKLEQTIREYEFI